METGIPDSVVRAAIAKVTGEDAVLASDVDWDLKSPCDDCPFLKRSPYHEGVASSLPNYVDSIEAHRFAHTCHKTDARPSVDGPRTWGGRAKHCAGAILMLLKTGNGLDLQLALLQACEDGKLDIHEMTERARRDSSVFTVPELLAFYARKIGDKLRRRRHRDLKRKKRR